MPEVPSMGPVETLCWESSLPYALLFSPNFMVYGRELFMPIDIMMGRRLCSEDVDELDYVRELRERFEDYIKW